MRITDPTHRVLFIAVAFLAVRDGLLAYPMTR
jgi:hypothetical protein